MKKIILMLAIMIAAATNITAKGSNMAFGVDYNYSSKGGGSGVGFQLEYELLKNLRIYTEQTLQLVNDATRFIPAFGLKYKF